MEWAWRYFDRKTISLLPWDLNQCLLGYEPQLDHQGTHIHTHTYVHTLTHTHTRTHKHSHTHTHVHTNTHTHTHTYTNTIVHVHSVWWMVVTFIMKRLHTLERVAHCRLFSYGLQKELSNLLATETALLTRYDSKVLTTRTMAVQVGVTVNTV